MQTVEIWRRIIRQTTKWQWAKQHGNKPGSVMCKTQNKYIAARTQKPSSQNETGKKPLRTRKITKFFQKMRPYWPGWAKTQANPSLFQRNIDYNVCVQCTFLYVIIHTKKIKRTCFVLLCLFDAAAAVVVVFSFKFVRSVMRQIVKLLEPNPCAWCARNFRQYKSMEGIWAAFATLSFIVCLWIPFLISLSEFQRV